MPEPLRGCSWNSPYSCGLRIWPSAPGYRRFKAFISLAPPTHSWVQAGHPTTCYHPTPRCTQHLVAFNRDPPRTPQPDPPSSSQTIDPRPPPPLPPPALRAPPRLPEPIVEPIDDLHLRSCVEHYTYTGWAREQRTGPICSATPRFLSLGSPSPPPDGLLDYIPSTFCPSLTEVPTLATKYQLHTTDVNTVLLVRRPHTDPTYHARDPPPPPFDPPPRVCVPMLMRPWVLHTCHPTTACHLGFSRTFSMLRRLHWCW